MISLGYTVLTLRVPSATTAESIMAWEESRKMTVSTSFFRPRREWTRYSSTSFDE
ncbi:MAG: hypothetical protein ACD_75C01821G0001 [uncultured bacterium]|nr:MAG: hypothetical protein ACD_75C01821G0001 [uncultured bacterium]